MLLVDHEQSGALSDAGELLELQPSSNEQRADGEETAQRLTLFEQPQRTGITTAISNAINTTPFGTLILTD